MKRSIPLIGVAMPGGNTPTDFYRAAGPLSLLERAGLIQVDRREVWRWDELMRLDALFLVRPKSTDHLSMMELARAAGVPLWVDWDDDPFSIDPRNPAYIGFATPDTMKVISACIEIADIVTVSTPHLREQFLTRAKDVRVIRNAWDDRFWPMETPGYSKVVVWRGSVTHQSDFATVGADYNKLMASFEWQFIFMGMMPAVVDLQTCRRKPFMFGVMPFFHFSQKLRELRAAVMLNPLEDSSFNRSKSDIAFLEGCSAGCAVLGPDLPEWSANGCLTYPPGEFYHAAETLILNEDVRHHLVEAGQLKIREERRLEDANLLRVEVIKCLSS